MKARLNLSTFLIEVLAALAGCLLFGGTSFVSAQDVDLRQLPAARQTGGSCGFFANVPALTLATGVDIYESPPFLRSIYGLRRGDFRYERSFDKRMFYELFSLPYSETKIEHPPGIAKAMMPDVRKLITGAFHEGLANGLVYSLRIKGIFNGPHNGLLLGRHGNGYLLHDPYPGVIKTVSLDKLADLMLVRSTSKKNQGKIVFVTHFLTVKLPSSPRGKIVGADSMPVALDVALSVNQRATLKRILDSERLAGEGSGLSRFIASYPELDFAALPGKGEKESVRNVIGADLKADELAGLLHLSKFTLNTWHLKKRPLLPILVMDGQPWVLVRYLEPDPADSKTATLVFDNGEELLWLSPSEALSKIRKDGALYATMPMSFE